jgi:hypothetical protein
MQDAGIERSTYRISQEEEKKMAKYFMLWEIDSSKAPVNPKERAAAWSAMLNMIRQGLKEGTYTDWGGFVGETRGYAVSTMTDVELSKDLQKYFPYIKFQVHQALSAEQVAEVTKSLT